MLNFTTLEKSGGGLIAETYWKSFFMTHINPKLLSDIPSFPYMVKFGKALS